MICFNFFLKKAPILATLFFTFPLFGADISKKEYRVSTPQETRLYEDISFDQLKGKRGHFTVSLPTEIPPGGLPTILIIGGLQTGRETLNFIPNHGKYALIAYEYPPKLKMLYTMRALFHLYEMRKSALSVPQELVAMAQYIQEQPWSDRKPVSLMGYSFGATFIPVTYCRAQQEGVPLGPGAMVYGGAGMYALLQANLPFPLFLKKCVAKVAAALFQPIDPILYADRLKGEFLIINGLYDSRIPLECAERLQTLVPEPKTVINLKTGHMTPKSRALNLYLINFSRNWLIKKR